MTSIKVATALTLILPLTRPGGQIVQAWGQYGEVRRNVPPTPGTGHPVSPPEAPVGVGSLFAQETSTKRFDGGPVEREEGRQEGSNVSLIGRERDPVLFDEDEEDSRRMS